MARVQNGIETLPKISTGVLLLLQNLYSAQIQASSSQSCTNVTYRQMELRQQISEHNVVTFG